MILDITVSTLVSKGNLTVSIAAGRVGHPTLSVKYGSSCDIGSIRRCSLEARSIDEVGWRKLRPLSIPRIVYFE
jgi:hypothetical protein